MFVRKASRRVARKKGSKSPPILTVGHSTRKLGEFLELLRTHGVQRIVDIRTVPRSRHNPQFNGDTLARKLRAAGIAYVHLKKLGGLRHALKNSRNRGWDNASFRGFADYMAAPAFEEGLERLLTLGGGKRSAILCAEAVPWRCHRSLVADALIVRGVPVHHILSGSRLQRHRLTPFARVHGRQVMYPAPRPSPATKA
jgi:uncharacterized protein (DUF488 family)